MNNSVKRVLITGATSGIGYDLAKLFAADGYEIVIVARSNNELSVTTEELKRQFDVNIISIVKDLSLVDAPFELFEETKSKGLDIDILVNNAGQGLYGEFADTDINRELSIIQLNISSLVVLTKYFLKDMLDRGQGKILNLSSVASKAPGPLQSVYHGTKAFVQSFSEAVRDEVKDSGITITALLPGATGTDFFNKAGMLDAKNVKEGKLADAAGVAKDGYDALMRGDDMVVSGFMNKIEVAMSNILPDSTAAKQVHKQQKPVTGKSKK
jgi:short-subunit dehydrogenase